MWNGLSVCNMFRWAMLKSWIDSKELWAILFLTLSQSARSFDWVEIMSKMGQPFSRKFFETSFICVGLAQLRNLLVPLVIFLAILSLSVFR